MSNEFAERVRERLGVFYREPIERILFDAASLDLDAALASERKAVVERYEPILRALVEADDEHAAARRATDRDLVTGTNDLDRIEVLRVAARKRDKALAKARAILDAEAAREA